MSKHHLVSEKELYRLALDAYNRGRQRSLITASETADNLIDRENLTGDCRKWVAVLRDGLSAAANLMDMTGDFDGDGS